MRLEGKKCKSRKLVKNKTIEEQGKKIMVFLIAVETRNGFNTENSGLDSFVI